MKPCAHVTCKTCTDTLVRPAKQCVVCDTTLGDKDIIELKREGDQSRVCLHHYISSRVVHSAGTGFAGGGMAETSKAGIAFQG